ncbi:MAG: hypothetical protein AB1772_06920 [Candidatus Zixiibacteriota bacterium]
MQLASAQGDPASYTGSPHRPSLKQAGQTQRGHMSVWSRILVALAALALAFTYYFPLWEITLDAPQYPEGLGMEIWINQIQGQHEGDLNKINNLNHYIGMKKIVPESIPELGIMPWVMRALMILGLVAAIVGKRSFLLAWIAIFVLVCVAGLVDFYLWGYDYGHNLDTEHAIIKVPGLSYQPPLIGTKNLLNFKAISLPGAAGWVVILALSSASGAWLYEVVRHRKGAVNVA